MLKAQFQHPTKEALAPLRGGNSESCGQVSLKEMADSSVCLLALFFFALDRLRLAAWLHQHSLP